MIGHQKNFIWKSIKRTIDIIGSLTGLLLSTPIILYSAFKINQSSKGPIFYLQERIGLNGHSFKIYKLRSMFEEAETEIPLLASLEDPRITPWGKTMRKWRIDELPQFLNVLKGDMSIVGPRPERAFYINKIKEQRPDYLQLLNVKPGITSAGMINFGYAENIEEMIERMQYDLAYVNDPSFFKDLKIIIGTFSVLTNGKGK